MACTKLSHLFYVHSHIVYLVALAVIRHRRLELADCAFIYPEIYSPPTEGCPVRSFVMPTEFERLEYYCVGEHSRIRENLHRFDSFFLQAVGGRDFVWYVPKTHGASAPWIPVLASHDKCRSYCILEEGEYLDSKTYRLETSMPRITGTSLKTSRVRLYFLGEKLYETDNPKYYCAYVTFEKNLSGVKNRIVLNDVFEKTVYPPMENADAVLLLGNIARTHRAPVTTYLETLDWLIRTVFVPKGYRRVLYRNKRRHNVADLCNEIDRLFARQPEIVFEEIADDVVMENIIYSYDVPYYFDFSALGMYAAVNGRKAYSFSPTYEAFEPEYRHWLRKVDYDYINYYADIGVKFLPVVTENGCPIPPRKTTFKNWALRKASEICKKSLSANLYTRIKRLVGES